MKQLATINVLIHITTKGTWYEISTYQSENIIKIHIYKKNDNKPSDNEVPQTS